MRMKENTSDCSSPYLLAMELWGKGEDALKTKFSYLIQCHNNMHWTPPLPTMLQYNLMHAHAKMQI